MTLTLGRGENGAVGTEAGSVMLNRTGDDLAPTGRSRLRITPANRSATALLILAALAARVSVTVSWSSTVSGWTVALILLLNAAGDVFSFSCFTTCRVTRGLVATSAYERTRAWVKRLP